MDLGTVRDEVGNDPPGILGVRRSENGDAIGLEGGLGPLHA
jgi:hypothetical protein